MTKFINEEFLDVLFDKGPATIVSVNGNPASVVNTWTQYISVVRDNTLLIPAAGMHSIENDFKNDPKHDLTIAIGSYNYEGKVGMGRGYHIQPMTDRFQLIRIHGRAFRANEGTI